MAGDYRFLCGLNENLSLLFLFMYQPEEAERFWFVFILYSAKRLSSKDGDNVEERSDDCGVTLCQILRAAKLRYILMWFYYDSV